MNAFTVMKQLFFLVVVVLVFNACQQPSEADFDNDNNPDILVRGTSLKDLNKSDQVLIVDSIVVNAVTNQQWVYSIEKGFILVEDKAFKMKYNPSTEEWTKVKL